jgi:FkbM family methyltransferase
MRKVFVDCGANEGQSIDLFINSWDDAIEYKIYSFEANKEFKKKLESKKEFYNSKGYDLEINVPVAVWDRETENELGLYGYEESAVVLEDTDREYNPFRNNKGKGSRGLVASSVRLSTWILKNFVLSDHIVLKLDVEGSEYRLVEDLYATNALAYIDDFFYEWHGPKKGFTFRDDMKLLNALKEQGVTPYVWNGNHTTLNMVEVDEPRIRRWYARKGFKI